MDKLRQAIIILEEAAKEIEAGEPLHPVYDRRDQVAWGIRKAKKKIKQIREDIIFYKKLKEEINKTMVKVYIKIDEENNITDIGSEIFIEDPEGWIEIDKGRGDRYVHAQGNYLPKPINDEEGNPRYKYVNGEIYEVVQDDENQTHLVLVTIE